jgi:Saf4/Yju2 protein
MKCRKCSKQEWIIETDPENRGFKYVSGVQRLAIDIKEEEEKKVLQMTKGKSKEVVVSNALSSDIKKLDAIESNDKFDLGEERRALKALREVGQDRYSEDADRNADLRSLIRKERQKRKLALKKGQELGWRAGMALLGSSIKDQNRAQGQVYGNGRENEKERWKKVRSSSIFDKSEKKSSSKSKKRVKRQRIKQEYEQDDCDDNQNISNAADHKRVKVESIDEGGDCKSCALPVTDHKRIKSEPPGDDDERKYSALPVADHKPIKIEPPDDTPQPQPHSQPSSTNKHVDVLDTAPSYSMPDMPLEKATALSDLVDYGSSDEE